MIAWIAANALTVLVAAVVLGIAVLCLRVIFPGRGKSGCSGNCAGCSGCGGSCASQSRGSGK